MGLKRTNPATTTANDDGLCSNMGHFLAAVTVTVGYSDTFADPRGCHCNRQSLYLWCQTGVSVNVVNI